MGVQVMEQARMGHLVEVEISVFEVCFFYCDLFCIKIPVLRQFQISEP